MWALLTAQDIEDWKADYIKHADRIAHLKNEFRKAGRDLEEAQGKLEKAALFSPEVKQWLNEQSENVYHISLPDAIVLLLKGANEGLDKDEIRLRLPGVGYDESKLQASPNYFSTALRRLQDRNAITSDVSGKFRLVQHEND